MTDIERLKTIAQAAKASLQPSGVARTELLADGAGAAERWLKKAGLDPTALQQSLPPAKQPTVVKPTSKTAAGHARRLSELARIRRSNLAAHPAVPPVPPETIQPLFIMPEPAGILVDSQLIPDNNWAGVQFTPHVTPGGYNVGFFYIWTNTSSVDVVATIDTSLGFIGYFSVTANRAFSGGHAFAGVGYFLNVYPAWEQDAITLTQDSVTTIEVDSFGLWLQSKTKSAPLDSIVDISAQQVVPAGAAMAIEVVPYFVWDYDNGSVDFDLSGPGYRITNPNMTITTEPFVIF
jgi:hypothetical protein